MPPPRAATKAVRPGRTTCCAPLHRPRPPCQTRAVDTATSVNGAVYTARSESDTASAFRIEDATFTWVGRTEDLTEEERDAAHDLAGATVLPGLLDVHTHVDLEVDEAARQVGRRGARPCWRWRLSLRQ